MKRSNLTERRAMRAPPPARALLAGLLLPWLLSSGSAAPASNGTPVSAPEISQAQVSRRYPARAIKATPEQTRLNTRHDQTVEEGAQRLPTQAPPRKRQAVDPEVQAEPSAAPQTDAAGEGPDALGAPVVNVAGILSNGFPPDTVGDIGRNHYIQMTNAPSNNGNTVFQIFDKAGNDLSSGPQRFGGLWPAGDPCNSDLGDPIVVYDHLADRWNLSQFARNEAEDQFWMCFAISQTPDPTAGTWFVYTIEVNSFPDYPKIGVWPDGYYMSSYEGTNLGVFVFDRNAMLTGAAAAFAKFTIGSLGTASVRDTRILPADLDGPAPPAGTPNYFVRSVDDQQDGGGGGDRVEVYEFAANWTTNTFNFSLADTLTAPGDIQPFDIMTCNRTGGGVRDCVPQPGTTSTVDALSNRPMMQLKYRNFGAREAMVFNQTIDVSGSVAALLGITVNDEVAGVRWYELERSGGAWGVGQQGTFAPQPIGADSEAELMHRWMGSMAIDREGNMALGYSAGNSDGTAGQQVFPGLRYAGRRFDDLAGQLGQAERVLLAGTNAETGGAGRRWGDYSAMSVDPADDCTFWFTSHVATGTGGKPTRIGAFRYDTCGTDLSITKTDAPDPVVAGQQLRYDITVTNLGGHPAPGVTVLDTLPADVVFQSANRTCTLAMSTLSCDLGDLAAGQARGLSIVAAVKSSAADGSILSNVATVSSDTGDPNEGNNTAQADTQVATRADLSVAKLCKPDGKAVAGTTAHCEIIVDNLGASDAKGVKLVDAITSDAPFTVTGVTVSPSGSCAPATPIGPVASVTLNCDLQNMAAGSRKTVRVEFASQEASDVNDVATVSSQTTDPVTSNNTASGKVSFAGSANLSIAKTSAPAPVVAGTNLVYTLTVGNSGPSSAPNVVVKDALPGNVSVVGSTSSQGSCNGGTPGSPLLPMICTLGTLASGDSATITLTVLVDPSTPDGTVLVNNATVESGVGDPDNSNNSASALTSVQARADLSVSKISDKAVYKPSSLIAYTITVRNNGTSDARAVVVTDELPNTRQALYQSDTGGCTKAGNKLTCQVGDMAVGDTRSFNVYMIVKGSRGQIVNTAIVNAATVDPALGNNTSVHAVSVGK